MPDRMTIVLADDDEDDRALAVRALKDSEVRAHLRTVNDGQELLDFLNQRGDYADERRPSLVLLDLNMPRMDGHEALAAIKNDPALKAIPVVVLTTSQDEDDMTRVYEACGNSFITKPIGYDALVDKMRSCTRYWADTVSLPRVA